MDNLASKTTTIDYIGPFVYQNDTLQFIGQEEGRIRPATPGNSDTFYYDYFEKDHLGNVRVVLTDQLKQDVYPAATLEGTYGSGTAAVDVEKNYYTINSGDIVASSTATGISTYQNNNGNPPYNNNPNGSPTANSAKLYKLNATASKTGLGITLKVMSGDKIDIFGKSYYFQNNAGDGSGYNLAALDILTALIGSPQGGTTAVHGAVSASDLNGISGTPVGTFLSGGGRTLTNTSTPRAYINYIILDEQFKYVSGGFSAVDTNSTVKDHHSELQDIAINKNGYIFIYCSNESPVNVFFDNLQVVHTRGPLLEETHYYPFGLTMVGISSQALNFGGTQNKYKYNGKEEQRQEFSDDSGLEWYDYKHRFYDNQIGRFFTQDKLASDFPYYSPYQFAGNEVPNAIDLDGLEPWRVNRYMSSDAYAEQRRSYREVNSFIPRVTSYRNSGTYTPNQTTTKTVRTPSDIYEPPKPGSGEQFNGPFITKGNTLGMLGVRMTKAVNDLQKQIETVAVTTDHIFTENSATSGSSISISWKSKDAENSFNKLQQQYNNLVNEINAKNPMPTIPNAGASQEEWNKWITTAQEVARIRGFAIFVLGPSPMQQIANSVESKNGDFEKTNSVFIPISEVRRVQQ